MRSKKNLVGILALESQRRKVDAFSTSTNFAIASPRSSSLHVAAKSQPSNRTHQILLSRSVKTSQHALKEEASPSSYRSYCPRCQRPAPTCLCHALPRDGPISLPNIRVLILQHPREARKRKRTSTVPLIGLCLDDVTICVGTRFGCGDDNEGKGHASCPEALREVLNKPGEDVILLYPGETALPLNEREVAPAGKASSRDNDSLSHEKVTLMVIDGTWAQTQSIYQQSPCLQRLPQYMFTEDTESLFDPIRQEPASHCTSSLEAISRALRIVGGRNKEDDNGSGDKAIAVAAAAVALEDSLRAMVKGQMQYANDASKSRPRTKNNNSNNNRNGDTAATGKGRKIRKRRQAQLSLPRPMTEEEVEASRIRFIYVAHLG